MSCYGVNIYTEFVLTSKSKGTVVQSAMVQILHCGSNQQWIVASNINCPKDIVCILISFFLYHFNFLYVCMYVCLYE